MKNKDFSTQTLKTKDYELILSGKQKGLLVLFPCYPCNAENTKAEFNIIDVARENGISLLLMNFNLHLYLLEDEKAELAELLASAINDNCLQTDNIYIGGFSGGGNVALLLGNYLLKTKHKIQPKGVFSVDSSVELFGLYANAKKAKERKFSEVAVGEANYILSIFDMEHGTPGTNNVFYEKHSPFVLKTNSIKNVSELTRIKVRLYSEPDMIWNKKNKQDDYEDMNAYHMEMLTEELQKNGGDNVEYITSENRGYRANGERHPHSWSIVDEKEMVEWMLEK